MMKLKNIKIGRIKENVNVALEIDQRLTTLKQQGGGDMKQLGAVGHMLGIWEQVQWEVLRKRS